MKHPPTTEWYCNKYLTSKKTKHIISQTQFILNTTIASLTDYLTLFHYSITVHVIEPNESYEY